MTTLPTTDIARVSRHNYTWDKLAININIPTNEINTLKSALRSVGITSLVKPTSSDMSGVHPTDGKTVTYTLDTGSSSDTSRFAQIGDALVKANLISAENFKSQTGIAPRAEDAQIRTNLNPEINHLNGLSLTPE